MNLEALKAPFAPSKISWRIGSTNADKSKGMALAYIDARDVQDRLDEVCRTMGWQCRYVPMHDKKTVCEIGIYSEFHLAWVWKADGAGDSDVEAEKGALSDAFKRAAVKWGVGRYLYDIDSPWVDIEPAGKSFRIKKDQMGKLRAALGAAPQTSRLAGGELYAPLSIKTPEKPATDRAAAAKSWALGEIPRIKTMDKATLDKFSERFKKTREELKVLDAKTSVELEKALADRLEALFA